MEESSEFMTEHDLYISHYNSVLGHASTLLPVADSQDDDTDDPVNDRNPRRRPMTKAEKEAYWDYKGPPTITDSFFRASNQAAAAGFSPAQSGTGTPSTSALADSPKQKATRGAYAFGHKLPEGPLSAKKDFDLKALLDQFYDEPGPKATTSTLTIPKSAPPTITVHREASVHLDALPPHTATGAGASRRPARAAAANSRSATPNPAMKALVASSRNPRQFRSKPAVTAAANINRGPSLARQAIMTAASAAFDSDGELSSVSSSASDTEAQDSDTKWRTERATRLLEPKDVSFPSGLTATLFPSLAAAEGRAAVSNGNLQLPESDRRAARSASGTPEPSLSGPITVSMGGIKTRRRPQLSEYPLNELQEIEESDMRVLRETYVALTQARKKAETFGAKFKENPMGEWQVKMEESNVRGS